MLGGLIAGCVAATAATAAMFDGNCEGGARLGGLYRTRFCIVSAVAGGEPSGGGVWVVLFLGGTEGSVKKVRRRCDGERGGVEWLEAVMEVVGHFLYLAVHRPEWTMAATGFSSNWTTGLSPTSILIPKE